MKLSCILRSCVMLLLPEFFDDTYYPNGLECVPKKFAVEKANMIVLQETNFLVAYVFRDGGDSAKILHSARRAEQKGYMRVFNLCEL